MFTGCGKSGKSLGGSAGWGNWEDGLRGDFDAEFVEGAEKMGRLGAIWRNREDDDDADVTNTRNCSTEYNKCQVHS
jgi:hypothetical protein